MNKMEAEMQRRYEATQAGSASSSYVTLKSYPIPSTGAAPTVLVERLAIPAGHFPTAVHGGLMLGVNVAPLEAAAAAEQVTAAAAVGHSKPRLLLFDWAGVQQATGACALVPGCLPCPKWPPVYHTAPVASVSELVVPPK
jgi:hypothetical protein